MDAPQTKREGHALLAQALTLDIAGDFMTVVERVMRLDRTSEAEAIRRVWTHYDPDRVPGGTS